MSHLKCVTMLTQKSVQKGYFFLENCVELCVHKIGDKLGKIHTEWVILWNNVNKIISLKKLHSCLGYYYKEIRSMYKGQSIVQVQFKIEKVSVSSQNMERLCEMGEIECEMNIY